jgi:NAD(P) transhydrogenase subunit alpha
MPCGGYAPQPNHTTPGKIKILELFTYLFQNREVLYIILFCSFLGIEIISHVPLVLLSPMNSAINSIHGLIVLGAIYVVGKAKEDDVSILILGFIAIIFSTMNLVGGSLFTDRMLKVFKKKESLEE